MNRLLPIFLTLLLFVGAPMAHAACPSGQVENVNGMCEDADGNIIGPATQSEESGLTEATQQQNIANDPAANKKPTEGVKDADEAYNSIMVRIMGIFAWLAGVAMLTLEYAIYHTVVQMSVTIQSLVAIGDTWTVFRDLGNIVLIFGFLAIGITTILNVDWYGKATKMLPMLLIVAVFLNFSLFITSAIIDTGNLFATKFYQSIVGGAVPAPASFGDITTAGNQGVAGKIMDKLGLATIYGKAQNQADALTLLDKANPFLIGFMSILLFIVLAFVLFALAFVLIARFVILLFLIIIAPIGFVGLAVPQLENKAKQWWGMLFKQTLTAPVLLLLLYIALKVIVSTGFPLGGTPDWTGTIASSNLPGFGAIFLSFLIAMGLLLAVVIASKQLSAFGAGQAIKWGGKLSFGATALGASTLFGGAAFGLRKGLQRYAPNSRFVRAVSNYALRPLEKAKFDVRSIGGGAALGAIGLGEAGTPIGASAVVGARRGVETVQKFSAETNREYDQETRIPRLRQAIAANDGASIGRLLGNMSDKELESSSIQRLISNSPVAAATLSQARFDKLMTSEALNDAQKNDLRTRRNTGLVQRYTSLDGTPQRGRGPGAEVYRNPPDDPVAPGLTLQSVRHPGADMTRAEQAVRSLSNEAVSQLPDAILAEPEVYENLSIRQLNAIQNAGRIQDATAYTIRGFLERDGRFQAYFAACNSKQQRDLIEFWHLSNNFINLFGRGGGAGGGAPAGGAPAGGAPGGGPQPPPGFQQNPGGNIFIPAGGGGGPRRGP